MAESDPDLLVEDSAICLECTGGDSQVELRIARDGRDANCAVCGRSKRTIPFVLLLDMIDAVFRKYVRYRDPWPWGRGLSTPNEIIHDAILGCESDALVEALVRLLQERERYGVAHDGDTPLYDAFSESYEISVPYSSDYDDEWERFEEGVKHRGRFFLDDERDYLERIFRPVLRGDLHRGQPPFITLGDENAQIRVIYRARAANTAAEQKRIFGNPARELAPPPATLRTAGRMNPAGVGAFYGATDVSTCVAELAIPFGGAAIVGTFEFLRPVRVLDLRLLSRASLSVSYFDPDLDNKVGYRRFMQRLRNLLRKPVIPGAEPLEYLPTQMVAEFLSHENLSGVIFVSSVTPEAGEEARYEASSEELGLDGEGDLARTTGLNIVLFAHAALVEGRPPRRRVLRVERPQDLGSLPIEGWLDVRVAPGLPPDDRESIPYPAFDDAVEPTLKLIEDEVVLAVPQSIEYRVSTYKPNFREFGEDEF